MYIVIAGGGKLGYYLAKTLLSYNHKVIIIEKQKSLCEKVSNELNIPSLTGDATNIDNLSLLDLDKANIFIAVTGKDEENLIACQLVKANFKVKKTIARVNNPKNINVFKRLGVDIAVSSTAIIAELIEHEVDYFGVNTLLKIRGGKIVISEMKISDHSEVCNCSLRDLKIPRDCRIVSIIREDEVMIPSGDTIIMANDEIITVSSKENQRLLKEFFLPGE